ncbi:MAG: lipocalin-like domain-containing protein [Bacteroidota bacterium]
MHSRQSRSFDKKFFGTWRLIAYEILDPDGHSRHPLGKDAIGILSYDAKGNMSGQLSKAKRRRYASDDLRKGTPEEMTSAVKSYVAYFGVYKIDPVECSITHYVEGSLFPNWLDQPQKRFFKFANGRLILSAEFKIGGKTHTAILTWKRAT